MVKGTYLQKKVWDELKKISKGEVLTYINSTGKY